MVWAALGGVVGAVSPAGVRKAAAGVGHGAAHLLLLVADARKAPGVRAVQEQGGGDEEQGDAVALARSTSASEENDSSHLTESLYLLNLTMTMHCRCSTERFGNEKKILELVLGEVTTQCTQRLPDFTWNFWRRF